MYHKNGIYVSVIDLSKASINVGNVVSSDNNKFNKYSLIDWWNSTSNKLAIYNGQFFSMNGWPFVSNTTMSFPLISNWNMINSTIDYGSLRTLRVNDSVAITIHSEYNNGWFMNNTKDLIVGLSPYSNKSNYDNIGRFYIGGIPNNSNETNSYSRTMKYLLFFIGKNKNQSAMFNEAYKWNIVSKDLVMMDGSGSAQMKIGSLEVYGGGFPTKEKYQT